MAYHLKNISHYYGSTKVLGIDDLKIKAGSITGLIGPNGSGKSTLLQLLAFAQKPDKGEIFYNGLRQFPFSPVVRSKVTLLTQKPYLLKRTVFENIAYGLKIRKDKRFVGERVKNALKSVGLDDKKFAQRKWHELSGGEAQRVAMAARLILKPEVLLLDEPIASVDTESAELIRKASLNARKNWGTTLVIVSHDLQWLSSISDKQLSIFKGNIFSTGMENIITGPFKKLDDQILVKKLGDGQVITLKAPAIKIGTAVIKKQCVCLRIEQQWGSQVVNQAINQPVNQLSGHIVSMLLEKKTGHIMATVSIYDLSFVLILTRDQITGCGLYPGKKVILTFQPWDVEWF